MDTVEKPSGKDKTVLTQFIFGLDPKWQGYFTAAPKWFTISVANQCKV
jgi:hypothetical protein